MGAPVTLRMADSIAVANLPPRWPSYAGYVDGNWQTWPQLKVRFPNAHLLSVAVFANSDAECCDCEAGDLLPGQVVPWVRRQLARGEPRPCVYASVANFPPVLDDLRRAGIKRAQVRLWSAHYGTGPHICGPASCKYFPGMPAFDGTQWTDLARGAHGSRVDASLLTDDFFTGGPVSASGPEYWDTNDWNAFRNHLLTMLTRALTGNANGLGEPGAAAVANAHKAFTALVPSTDQVAQAVVAKLPPAQAGGLTGADVQAAVHAGLVSVLAKAVTGG